MEEAERTFLPIRYGRRSTSRENTYTMVFSRLCYRQRALGKGFVVPYSHEIHSWNDLQAEVMYLSNAEGLSGRCWNWGVVGLLQNPFRPWAGSLTNNWMEFFGSRTSRTSLFGQHARSEAPAVGRDGVLRLRWPCAVSGQPIALDALLATATTPTLTAGRYPSAETIAEAYCHANLPDYFLENNRAGIRTFQDSAIARRLVRVRPGLRNQLLPLL